MSLGGSASKGRASSRGPSPRRDGAAGVDYGPPTKQRGQQVQIDQIVAELLARGDMNDDTVIDLNRMLDNWREGKLDPEDESYLRALHARVMHLELPTEEPTPAASSRLDG